MRYQFIEGLFDSRIQLNLYEDERDRDFGETLQRAQELEVIHKTHESKRERKLDKLRKEKFAALQTSLTNVASRFDCFKNSICHQISKQAVSITKQTETLVQGMKDMSSAIVGALGSSQRPVGGQPQSCQDPHFHAPSLLIFVRR